jgi:hypothetical protein
MVLSQSCAESENVMKYFMVFALLSWVAPCTYAAYLRRRLDIALRMLDEERRINRRLGG